MPLNIISNFAANVAHRNLSMSDRGASDSVAKISAGTRVLAARDDAAGLAIGSRLRAEVAAMEQASVNAGQAVSMLQIADGAMAQINDTLVRMQALAVQAGSDQLGSTERSLIDSEYQQLLLEVDRIAADTEFNGQSLINGGTLYSLVQASDAGTDGFSSIAFDATVTNASVFQYSYASATETLTVTKTAVDGATVNTATDIETNQQSSNNVTVTLDSTANSEDVFSYSYESTGQFLTVTNQRTSETATIDITDAFNTAFGSTVDVITTGNTLAVDFGSLGVTVTLDDGFDRTNDLAQTAVSSGANLTTANESIALGTSITSTALNTLLNTTIGAGNGYDASTGILTLAATASLANSNTVVTGIAGVNLGNGVGNALTIADGTGDATLVISDANGVTLGTVTADYTATANAATTIAIDLGGLVRNVQTNTAGTAETVQIDLTDELDAVAGTGNNLSFNETLDVEVSQFGVSLTLDKGFDRTSDLTTTTGAVTDSSTSVTGGDSFSANTGFLTADVYQALLDLGYDSTTGIGYNANTGVLNLGTSEATNAVTLDGLAGIRYDSGVAGEASVDVNGGSNTTAIDIVLSDGTSVNLGSYTATYANGQPDGSTGTIGIQLGRGVFFNEVDTAALTNDFTFKIGTGQASQDEITLSLNSVTTQALGINGTDTTSSTTADAAATAISGGITTLNGARANIGAFQNRLEIAVSNLATATENTEAARSALLDLDVAKEMTTFTSKQILVQAGVSMLAQANQLPQNLLRLLQ